MRAVLLNGSVIDTDAVEFNRETYHFYLGGVDITNQLKREDKREGFVDFDDSKDNLRVYNELHPGQAPTGPTTIWGNFVEQVTTDPLAAPVEMLERGVDSALNTTTVKVGLVLLSIGVLAIIYANRPR